MKKQLHIISHSHWDREWYMGFEQHRARLVELMDALIDKMESDEEYRYFHLDGHVLAIEDYLEIRPEKRSRLEKLIRDGRIQVGPWYVLQDEFLTSGEANVRNMLEGLRYCEENGYEPVMSGYFPDAFGNISQAPQILRGFGIDNAVFGRGMGVIFEDNKPAEAEGNVTPYAQTVVTYRLEIAAPVLWDVDAPKLYTVETEVLCNEELCDSFTTRTGFRYYSCHPEKGFFLNGRPLKIQGVCAHEDCGLLGKAIPSNVHRYKMELLKEMGVNGYRTAHYQQNTAILDAADELGFIVLNESRWFRSTEDGIRQMETLVRRDRNRPSVFFWALGNEEYYHRRPQGLRMVKRMKAALRRLDPVRPVTCAADKTPVVATVFEEADLIGINYNLDAYEPLHEKYPNKPVLSTENSATSTTRGWYGPDSPELGYYNAYDKDTTRIFLSRERTWKFITERPWVMGGYQWSGFEHRGETVWPRLCSQAGAIDLFLQKKDAFYQNKSHFTDEPMVHLLPHWNFEGLEGNEITVFAYTNAEELGLFLNGESLGRKEIEKRSRARAGTGPLLNFAWA